MALPAAATVASTLTSVASRSPALVGVIGARLRNLGHSVGSTVDEMVSWVKSNPGNAAIAAATMASLGIQIMDVEGDVASALKQAALGELNLEDTIKVLQAGASSEQLLLGLRNKESDLKIAREVLGWARSHYGSVAAAKRAHALHQAFFEMSQDDIETGFDVLRV